jgi:hypothetical protein
MLNLPNWWFLAAYLIAGAWLLLWECVAAWIDRDPGDTVTELTRGLASSSPGFYLVAFGLLFLFGWLSDHFLLHDTIYRFLWRLR